MAWENLEKGRLMGFRVFTRGIWYTLTIFSIFGLLKSGSEVLFTPIRFGVTTLFTVMLLKCLFYDDGYPDPTKMPFRPFRCSPEESQSINSLAR
ncbi:unnamed protein product [Arabidopsis lyrata]|nr:unnamed protein product [Arabidopsis lyrata]